ncbi:MAG: sensor domain-containing diguanylate cyclase [Rubrivivax sp.]|nr:MAG: sensor domain-containing diguanylate cyclase [Rubrivivax sp.]
MLGSEYFIWTLWAVLLLVLGGALGHGLAWRGIRRHRQRARDLSVGVRAQLEQTEAKRQFMLETTDVSFFEMDVKSGQVRVDGRLLHSSPESGVESRPFSQQQWCELIHPDEVDQARAQLKDYLAGTLPRYELRFRIKVAGEEWRWVLCKARIVQRDEQGQPAKLFGSLIDVHQSWLMRLALHEEREMFATGPVVMIRAQYAQKSSKFVYVSTNVRKLWGYEPSALTSLANTMSIVHPDDSRLLRDRFVQAMESDEEGQVEFEARLRMADGTYRWHLYNSTIDRSHSERRGYFIDIDARKQAELEAAVQRQKLHEMVQQLRAAQDEGLVVQEASDMLHAADNVDEAFGIIRQACERLFPGWSGWLAATQAGGHQLQIGASWGRTPSQPEHNFLARDCWGMRRGKPHAFSGHDHGVCCVHLKSIPREDLHPYLCVPMVAHGETVGTLHLFSQQAVVSDARMADVQARAVRFAETLKLALSNLMLRASLHDQAMTDSLTGLHNRRFMDECLSNELQRVRRDHGVVSLAMIDIDHFKRFNDSHGHDAGDAVLRAVAGVLLECIRGYDIACRYGGEEMALVLPGCEQGDAVLRMEQIRHAIESLEVHHEGVAMPTVTISAGVAQASGGNAETLVRWADEALYQAKRNGRNQVKVSSKTGLAVVTEHGELDQQVRV